MFKFKYQTYNYTYSQEEDVDESEEAAHPSRTSMLSSVKLHHLVAHAPQDILGHGHEKHYSAQV